jgi:hypothetical protein
MDRHDATPGLPLLITIEEAADLLRLGCTRIYELVMSGQVVSVEGAGAGSYRAGVSKSTSTP